MDIPVAPLVRNMKLTVNVTGLRVFRWRVALGLQIMRLAAFVIGCGFHVEGRETPPTSARPCCSCEPPTPPDPSTDPGSR